MIVVSDATPLNILLRIGHVDILPRLFGHIVIPTAVAREMAHANAPDVVRSCARSRPDWLAVRSPEHIDRTLQLGDGELEALALATELRADLLLRKARRAATALGLRITGTLGVLMLAEARDLIDFDAALTKLGQTDFSLSKSLLEAVRRQRPQ